MNKNTHGPTKGRTCKTRACDVCGVDGSEAVLEALRLTRNGARFELVLCPEDRALIDSKVAAWALTIRT